MKVKPVPCDDGQYRFLIHGEGGDQIALSIGEMKALGDMAAMLQPPAQAALPVEAVIQAVTNAHAYGAKYAGPMWLALTVSAMLVSQGGMGLDSLRDVVSGDYLTEIDDWESRLAVILQEINPIIEELKVLEGVGESDGDLPI